MRQAGAASPGALLALLVAAVLGLSLWGFFQITQRDGRDRQYQLHAAQLQAFFQQIAIHGPSAAAGEDAAFVRLRQARAGAERIVMELGKGDARQGLPPSPATVKRYLDAVTVGWRELRQAVERVLEARQDLLSTREYANATLEAGAPLLMQAADLVDALAAADASPRETALASAMARRAQRLHDAARLLLAGDRDVDGVIALMVEDAAALGQGIASLRQGDAALDITPMQRQGLRSALADLQMLHEPLRDHVRELAARSALGPALAAADELQLLAEALSEQTATLIEAYGQSPSRPLLGDWRIEPQAMLALGGAAVLCLLAMIRLRDGGRRTQEQPAQVPDQAGRQAARQLKRLGESAQEMGDVAAQLEDISDRAQVLAMNAAIQASLAGEAGRGFGVVADEAQQLVERVGQARGRIETLVLAIQADAGAAGDALEAVAPSEPSRPLAAVHERPQPRLGGG